MLLPSPATTTVAFGFGLWICWADHSTIPANATIFCHHFLPSPCCWLVSACWHLLPCWAGIRHLLFFFANPRATNQPANLSRFPHPFPYFPLHFFSSASLSFAAANQACPSSFSSSSSSSALLCCLGHSSALGSSSNSSSNLCLSGQVGQHQLNWALANEKDGSRRPTRRAQNIGCWLQNANGREEEGIREGEGEEKHNGTKSNGERRKLARRMEGSDFFRF